LETYKPKGEMCSAKGNEIPLVCFEGLQRLVFLFVPFFSVGFCFL